MSDKHIKVGRLLRDTQRVELDIVKRDAAGGTRLSFPVSSERPVERYFGTEVLRHDAQSIRMDRLNDGAAPLLFNHNWDDPIGMVDGARLKDKRLWVDAHLFDTARAREVAAMIDGGMRNVSIGYELHEVTEDGKARTFTATDWSVLEVSFATVPADPSVGLGRDADTALKPVRVVRAADVSTPVSPSAAPAAQPKESTMDEVKDAAAGNSAENQQGQQHRQQAEPQQHRSLPMPQGTQGNQALELERARRRGIETLCKANGIEDGTRDYWVGSGLSLDVVADDMLKIMQERGDKNPQSKAKLGISEGETRNYSLVRALLAASENNWSAAGFELECSREISKRMNTVPDAKKFYVPFEVQARQLPRPRNAAQRDLTAGTPSAGGFLVGTENISFIEMLRNRSVAYRMGAMRLGGLQGNVTVPKQTGAATWYWLATEATNITESQQVLGQLALSPKTGGAYTEISRQLLLQSSPDAEVLVTSDLGRVGGLGIDSAVLAGSGASGQPTGIVNTAGIGSVVGTSLDFAKVLQFQTQVATANVLPQAGGYATTPAVAALMMARVKYAGTASPLWEGNLWDGSMAGFGAMSSNQMAAASMLFGDWESVVVAEWGVLEISVNPFANFQAGIIGVRAMVSMDCGLRYPAAFSLATAIT